MSLLGNALRSGRPTMLTRPDGSPSGLSVELFPVPGKVPLYLEQATEQPVISEGEETVGAEISDGDKRMVFIPGCARMTEALAHRLQGADVVLFDGTLWTDDEMLRAGLGAKTGLRMGHMSVSGPNGTIAASGIDRCQAEDPAAHQQFQPDPAGRFARTGGGRPPPVGKSPMTEWRSACERRACCRPTNWKRRCGRSAPSDITRSIRFIS